MVTPPEKVLAPLKVRNPPPPLVMPKPRPASVTVPFKVIPLAVVMVVLSVSVNVAVAAVPPPVAPLMIAPPPAIPVPPTKMLLVTPPIRRSNADRLFAITMVLPALPPAPAFVWSRRVIAPVVAGLTMIFPESAYAWPRITVAPVALPFVRVRLPVPDNWPASSSCNWRPLISTVPPLEPTTIALVAATGLKVAALAFLSVPPLRTMLRAPAAPSAAAASVLL